jgi:hypothetical protein
MLNRIWLSVIGSISISLFGLNQAISQAQAIAGATAVSTIIDSARTSVQSIISQLSADTTLNTFAMRQDLELLLQQLNMDASALEGKTFADINATQQSFFQSVANTLATIRNTTKVTTHQLDDLLSKANDALGTIPGADRDPRVLHYDPQYTVGGQPDVIIDVRGSWLGNSSPSLAAPGIQCSILSKTEDRLQFECPMKAFASPPKIVTATTLQLKVYKPLPWYRTLFGGQGEGVPYSLVVFSVPQQFGTYSVNATVPTVSVTTAQRSQSFYYSNGFCQGATNGVWTANTSGPGWFIDTNSISLTENTKNGASTNYTIPARSPGGFQISYTVTNSGSCGPEVLGIRTFVDGRGWLGITAHWTESMSTNGTQTVAVNSGDLYWGKAIPVTLPANAVAFTLTADVLGSQQIVSVQSEVTRWYSAAFNSGSHVLAITPHEPGAALQ